MPLPDALRECRLVPGRPIAGPVAALARDLVVHARRQSSGADSIEAVHQCRLVLKALRALLCLVPGTEGSRPPARLDAALRALGRHLSPTRDRDVARATLSDLVAKRGDPRQRAAANRWLRGLRRDPLPIGSVADAVLGLDRLQASLLRHLRRAAKPASMESGLARTFRKARRWHRRAAATGKPDAFHAWRRWQKRLEAQLRWTETKPTRGFRSLLDKLQERQEDLGRLHDLDVLATFLEASRKASGGAQARDAKSLLLLVLDRQRRLQTRLLRDDGGMPLRRIHRAVRRLGKF